VKRLLAVIAGGLGLRALLRRRTREPAPVEDLRAKLAASRAAPEDAPATAAGQPGVDERRADVHARARQAIDDLKS
jgi:hypothetical protein